MPEVKRIEQRKICLFGFSSLLLSSTLSLFRLVDFWRTKNEKSTIAISMGVREISYHKLHPSLIFCSPALVGRWFFSTVLTWCVNTALGSPCEIWSRTAAGVADSPGWGMMVKSSTGGCVAGGY
ncbi:hypothetical protein BDZ88DRAFT_418109 [Geranomyces variabilis]|nr:hypothetical protein BDZ88DRAFT_418109 [Geranomyces variabilis]